MFRLVQRPLLNPQIPICIACIAWQSHFDEGMEFIAAENVVGCPGDDFPGELIGAGGVVVFEDGAEMV
jgi:hypothetical protein